MRIAVVCVYQPRWDRGVSILKLQARSMTTRYCTSPLEAIEWLRTQNDMDGLGAMRVCRGKYHKYLVTSRDYSKKGECSVIMCNYLNETFDETVKKHRVVWIEVKKQCLRKTAVHDNLDAGNDDCGRLSTNALASFHTIVAKVLYVSKRPILDTSLGVEFLTMRVRATNTNE